MFYGACICIINKVCQFYGEEVDEWHDAQKEQQQHDARINPVLVSEAIRRNTAKWIIPGNDFKDHFKYRLSFWTACQGRSGKNSHQC